MTESPREMPVPLQVVLLIAPLGNDSERIFEEGDDDEEAS